MRRARMPFYTQRITAVAGSTRKTAEPVRWKLNRGIIHHVEIGFMAGCRGYAHAVIMRDGHQLWPSTETETFSGEDEIISFKEHYPLTAAPYSLRLIAWGPECDYNHVIRFRVGILPAWALLVLKPVTGLLEWLGRRL